MSHSEEIIIKEANNPPDSLIREYVWDNGNFGGMSLECSAIQLLVTIGLPCLNNQGAF